MKNRYKNRKRNFIIIFLRLPLVLLLLLFLFTSLSLFISTLLLCCISYFWIELIEDLKENNDLPKWSIYLVLTSGCISLVASLIGLMFSVYYVCIIFGINSYGFLFYKAYRLHTIGVKNSQLQAKQSVSINYLGLIIGIIFHLINHIAFGVILGCIFIIYVLADDVVHFKVERGDYKREV